MDVGMLFRELKKIDKEGHLKHTFQKKIADELQTYEMLGNYKFR